MAIQLGGATPPAANPVAQTAGNPNIRLFNVSCLDADTFNNFNHGLSNPNPYAIFTVCAPGNNLPAGTNWWSAISTPSGLQVLVSKVSLVGSGGATPGTSTVMLLIVFNLHTAIS